tara:strand:- start:2853 stop:4004 length:1152 start_codon:yes stop_codon:yes gene_type:complete
VRSLINFWLQHNNVKRGIIVALIVLLTFNLLLTGCGKKEKEDERIPTPRQTTAEEKPVPTKPEPTLPSGPVVPHSFEPSYGKVLHVIGQSNAAFDEYLENVHPKPAGAMFYTTVTTLKGLKSGPVKGTEKHNLQHYIDEHPNTILQIGVGLGAKKDPTIMIRAAARDPELEENIKQMALRFKETNRPLYVRIAFEANCLCKPNYYDDPKKYRDAYRFVAEKLREYGADNVAFVWHVVSSKTANQDFMAYYPGDDVVDWFAISIFSKNIFELPLTEEIYQESVKRGKPFMIAESTAKQGKAGIAGCKEPGKVDWDWFEKYFEFIRTHSNVKMFSYIGGGHIEDFVDGETAVDCNSEILEKWLEELEDSRYVHSSPGLYSSLGYV